MNVDFSRGSSARGAGLESSLLSHFHQVAQPFIEKDLAPLLSGEFPAFTAVGSFELNGVLADRIISLEKSRRALKDLVDQVNQLVDGKTRLERFVMWIHYFLYRWGLRRASILHVKNVMNQKMREITRAIESCRASIRLSIDLKEVEQAKAIYTQAGSFKKTDGLTETLSKLSFFFQQLIYSGFEYRPFQGIEPLEGSSPVLALASMVSFLKKMNRREPIQKMVLKQFEEIFDFRAKMGLYLKAFEIPLEGNTSYLPFYEALKTQGDGHVSLNLAKTIDPKLLLHAFVRDIGERVKALSDDQPVMSFYGGIHGFERVGDKKVESSHALIYRVEKQPGGTYRFSVFNTGKGALAHHDVQEKKGQLHVYPLMIDRLSLETVTDPSFLSGLLLKQLVPCDLNEAIEQVYQSIRAHLIQKGRGRKLVQEGVAYRLQTKASCTYSAMNMLMVQYFSDHERMVYKRKSLRSLRGRLRKVSLQVIPTLPDNLQESWRGLAQGIMEQVRSFKVDFPKPAKTKPHRRKGSLASFR